MALTEYEFTFIQNQDASDFPKYLKSVWHAWPSLKYTQARRKASKLWKARKEWLKTLEPTLSTLKNCPTCHSSFHQIWAPLIPSVKEVSMGNSILTMTQWEEIQEADEGPMKYVSCWGCKEDQPNQLAHMDYGGCLYECDLGLADPFEAISEIPELPASPYSTE